MFYFLKVLKALINLFKLTSNLFSKSLRDYIKYNLELNHKLQCSKLLYIFR